ncbi:MAG: bifunctional homocysteine S-methyltransferase/methylenetetrahydrofolate reductase [Parasporobacterium sp.]|nr:bifunctional homocysteine S-methyltransferase/methylenetetrahydrofolate reductase [Parasporobacterium sp.]
MNIKEYLDRQILIMDGAFGTYFDRINPSAGCRPEAGNILFPDMVKTIHKAYIEKGSALIRTNTFSANHGTFEEDAKLKEVIRRGWELAEDAVKESEKTVWIAADIGPVSENVLVDEQLDESAEYCFIADTFLNLGARIFCFETFSNSTAVLNTAAHIKKVCPDAFIMLTYAVDRTGYTSSGIHIQRLLSAAADSGVIDSCGCNCLVGVVHMCELLKKIQFPENLYMQFLPNSGYPHVVRGRAEYSDSARYFGEKAALLAQAGANLIGGCCGTTPEYIDEIVKSVGVSAPGERQFDKAQDNRDDVNSIAVNPFIEKLRNGQQVIAVELDPPFDQKPEKLFEGAFALKRAGVDIMTIADSPLAKPRADSVLLASRILQMTDLDVMPHIACRDRNRISMRSVLLGAHINNIRNLMIVTGDPVLHGDRNHTKPVFDFNSIQLMQYISDMNRELLHNDRFAFGGAINQNHANLEAMIARLQRKIDAGASWFLTQPIYSDEEIEKIRIMKSRLDTKILCGIMPLVSYKNAAFIKHEMPGITVPDEVLERYSPDMTREQAEAVAIEISLELIEKLNGIADGLYFMTPFNRVSLITTIIDKIPK